MVLDKNNLEPKKWIFVMLGKASNASASLLIKLLLLQPLKITSVKYSLVFT